MSTEKEARQHLYSRPPLDPNAEDSLAKIARRIPRDSTVLDVGCAVGMLGQYLTEHQGCSVDGIERNAEAAEIARPFYRRIVVTDLESADFRHLLEGICYDRIVCADVLEHLRDPDQVLQRLKDHLTPGGKILISIPNIGHIGVFLELLSGDFRYREEGLLDKTHLRFFTRKSFLRLLADHGFTGQVVDRTVLDLQHTEFSSLQAQGMGGVLLREIQGITDNLTYQFIVEAIPTGAQAPLIWADDAIAETASPIGPRFYVSAYWRTEDEGFDEARSLSLPRPFGVERSLVRFDLPTLSDKHILRLDPSDQPGFLRLYSLSLFQGDERLWRWDGGLDSFISGAHHDLLASPVQLGDLGISLLATTEDPWVVLPIPSTSISGADRLEVELSWPMSPDYVFALERVVRSFKDEQLLQQYHQRAKALEEANLKSQMALAETELQLKQVTDFAASTQIQVRDLQAQSHALQQENTALSNELAMITHSRSWRITMSLRKSRNSIVIIHSQFRKLSYNAFTIFNRKHYTEEEKTINKSKMFDKHYYLHKYQDVATSKIDPVKHYCSHGWREGRNPSRDFCTSHYLETYKDVRESKINPLYHYIRFGKHEGRRTVPNSQDANPNTKLSRIRTFIHIIKRNPRLLKRFTTEVRLNGLTCALRKAKSVLSNKENQAIIPHSYSANDLWNVFRGSPPTFTLNSQNTIDILIPVYNGLEFLKPLLESVIANTKGSYRLFICDDCSPDPQVLPLIYDFKEQHKDCFITIIENPENIGFVSTINKLASLSDKNFVILNTDVEVPPYWLERLMHPIIEDSRISSVTPFTNSGTICSFPNFLVNNDLPDGFDTSSLDRAFAFVHERNFVEVPTGVGFCMAINRSIWDKIGGFDTAFGKGYGEENDWCMRAADHGYKNLHTPNLFVYHKHGGSFHETEKAQLMNTNLALLNTRYPDYSAKVQKFIADDKFSFLRKAIMAKAVSLQFGCTIIFDHNLGGGANQYVDSLLVDTMLYVIIKYSVIQNQYELYFRGKSFSDLANLNISACTRDELTDIIIFFQAKEIIVNNLVSYPNVLEFIDQLCELHRRNIEVTYLMHDFYAVCPMYNLINHSMEYCGIPDDHDFCKKCLMTNPLISQQVSYIRSDYPNLTISQWRSQFSRLLDVSSKIVFFSKASLSIASKAFPNLLVQADKIDIRPHTVNWVRPVNLLIRSSDHINIGITGVLSFSKGAHVVSALASLIDSANLEYKIHIFGEVSDAQINLGQYSCVTIHGRYAKADLPRLLAKANIDIILIPSIWPETFSYTTEEAMIMDFPVAVFDLGAPAERVRDYNKGIILKSKSPENILKIMDQYFGRSSTKFLEYYATKSNGITLVCVSNNEYMYQRCISASSFMTAHRIIKYDNSIDNQIISKRYNDAILKLIDEHYDGWIFLIHNDFTILEDMNEIVSSLSRNAIYGPIGAILDNGKKIVYGAILQGHDGKLVEHGSKIEHPTSVDTVDCQCIFFHSDVVRKYPLRFDENDALAFHQYVEEFCLNSKISFGIKTYAVQMACKHLSWGRIDESFFRAFSYINTKYSNVQWAGTCTHLDQR